MLTLIIIGIIGFGLGYYLGHLNVFEQASRGAKSNGRGNGKVSEQADKKAESKEEPETEPEVEIYEGIIVKESLENLAVLDKLEILTHSIEALTNRDIYRVSVTPDDFEFLSKAIKPGQHFMHFWKGHNMTVIFRDKVFRYHIGDQSAWKKVIDYGLSLNIPIQELDFPTS
jgi:hypothetical protein